MKHKLLNPLRLLMVAICMLGLAAEGQEVMVDDFNFQIDLTNHTATCMGYTGSNEAPVMPAYVTYEGEEYPVTFIYHWAFQMNPMIKTMTLPETLKKIGESAFAQCMSLETMVIPNSVDTLMAATFFGCPQLKLLKLSENMKFLPPGLCFQCTSLETIEIPSSVTRFSCQWGDTNNFYNYEDWGDDSKLFADPNFFIVPGMEFRECSNLKEVILPKNLWWFSSDAFDQCISLKHIEIPCDKVKHILQGAFPATGLTEFEIPEELLTWGALFFTPVNGVTKYVKSYCLNPYPNFEFSGSSNQDYWPTCPLYVPKGMVPVYREVWPQWINARIVAATPVELTSEWRTFCAVEDLDFSGVEGLEAYVATEYQDGKVLMEPIEQVPAGTGVVLKGAPGFYEIPYPDQDEALEPVDNLLVGLNYGERIQAETEDGQCNLFFNDATEMASLFYGPFMDSERAPRLNAEGEQPMFAPAGGARLPYHRAYLQLPASEAGKTVEMVFGSLTGIEEVAAQPQTDGTIYNLQGQRVVNPGPGIYIQNGRKFIVR